MRDSPDYSPSCSMPRACQAYGVPPLYIFQTPVQTAPPPFPSPQDRSAVRDSPEQSPSCSMPRASQALLLLLFDRH